MRGATSVIVQTHQILRLPRKMNLMIDPCHTWNAIYNARSNKCHCPNSPNTAPATKKESHDWSLSHMKGYLQCAEQQVSLSKLTKYCACHEKWISWLILVTHETLVTMRGATSVIVQTHQILRLPRKMTLQNFAKISGKQLKRHFQYGADPRMIRAGSDHDPRMKPPLRNLKNTTFRAPAIIPNFTEYCACHEKWQFNITKYCTCHEKWQFNITKYCACHEKWISWLILVTHERLLTMRGATSVIVQTHQILRLPRKKNLMIDPCHTWNAIYNKRSNKCHCPNSPNTAPATQNDSPKFRKNFSRTAEKSFQIRGRSENDPSRIRPWSENETVTPQPASQARLLFALAASIFYWKIQHFALRLSFQISRNTAPATKSDSSTSPNTAPATKSDSSTSPNTAPATKNESHDWSLSHMKGYLQCAEQQVSLSKLTKYCACHEKRISWLILVTHERLVTMRGAKSVIVQTHQILRLPRKMTLQNFAKISRKQLKRHFQCGADPRMIRAGSDHDPRIKPSLRNPPRKRGYFSSRAFSIEKYNISCSGYHSKFHRILRLPRKVTVQHHQILRLPRKVTLERK